MKLRLESEGGEYLCDLDLTDDDVKRLLDMGLAALQKDPNGIKYNLPLKENDITMILQYAITKLLEYEITKENKK